MRILILTWRDLHQQLGALDTGVSGEEYAAEQRVAEAEARLQATRDRDGRIGFDQVARFTYGRR